MTRKDEAKLLRKPTEKDVKGSNLAQYLKWLDQKGYGKFKNYGELHKWSIQNLNDFWESIWKWSGVIATAQHEKVLAKDQMPGAKWFPGAKLNFAQNLLRWAWGGGPNKVAITSVAEGRPDIQITYLELLEKVGNFASFLQLRGVGVGDRVAAITTNGPEAVIGMLAATSIGAIWSSCSPDFGFQGILDRFGQIAPKVLIAVDGYRYGGKEYLLHERLQKVSKEIPSIETMVIVRQLQQEENKTLEGTFLKKAHFWDEIMSQSWPSQLEFVSLPFDHPVYILYSSGTTGKPKCIVHSAGGILLQHSKELMLHTNVTEEDRFFYFTTCGWMMWNWLVSGLMTGAELILFDGSPGYPSLDRLWHLAADKRITIFGTSAKFLGSCRTAGLEPGRIFHLEELKTICSTGSPLLPEDFDYVYQHVKDDVLLSSIAGGTDICSCFVLGNPMLPVYRGEIQCKGLGMAVAAYNEEGKAVINQKGELVCTRPAPCMPLEFWNDRGDDKYVKAYFKHFPGVWRHGDYIVVTERGGVIMLGRSDSTLNPSGVRIGTSEIYRQVETMKEVKDSLVVGQAWNGDQRVVLFVILKEGKKLDDELKQKIKARIIEGTTPRHAPAVIHEIKEIPYTISGKKVEIAVAKMLAGETIENRDALSNPNSLDQFHPELLSQ